MSRLVTLLMILGLGHAASAQDHHVMGLFPTLDLRADLGEKWGANVYAFLAVHPYEQVTAETTYPARSFIFYVENDVSYRPSDRWTLTASYTYERINPFRADYRNENRLWPQATYVIPLGRWNLHQRVRLDARFIQDRETGERPFTHRLRYRIGADWKPARDTTSGLYLCAYNEWFFNTHEGADAVYGENWAAAAIGLRIARNTHVEVGPLVISWVRNAERDWLHQYFLQVAVVQHLGRLFGRS